MVSKKDIRKRVLAERKLISKQKWEESSHKIFQKVVSHPFFLNADEIYCYVDYKNEVSTSDIIRQALICDKKVAVPKVIGDVMDFYYISGMDELTPGYNNIMEPTTEHVATGKNVLVIMPGAAFDKKKNRIGYGGGFYDKYLELHKEYHTLAIAFGMQIVEHIPSDTYDICPEVIITEEHVYV